MRDDMDGLFRYGWRKLPPHPKDAPGPFEGERRTTQPMTREQFRRTLAGWNAQGRSWGYEYWELPEDPPAKARADYRAPHKPFPDYNPARDGMTVRALADLLAGYAREHGDCVVSFSSAESGGYWPAQCGPSERSRASMGVFTGEQIAVVDSTRCGGGILFNIALLARKGSH